jgi:hypothetical protein
MKKVKVRTGCLRARVWLCVFLVGVVQHAAGVY